MLVAWSKKAREEYLYWQKTDKIIRDRINELIKDACRRPLTGRGKPEALRSDLKGYWSRRITHEHRLVYRYDAEQDMLHIVQCRWHYSRPFPALPHSFPRSCPSWPLVLTDSGGIATFCTLPIHVVILRRPALALALGMAQRFAQPKGENP